MEAGRRFLAVGGVAVVLGGPDTGKSTFCRYLAHLAFGAGDPAALVDLDLGQSHLGPPGSLGLGLFPPRFPGDDSLFPDALYFIGQTSPVGAVLEVAVGCRVLVDEARARGVDRVVVNTSGLIHGVAAHRLKLAEVELLQPRLVVTLEREGELASLAAALAGSPPLCRLPVSARTLRKTPEARRLYREARFRRYFAGARRLEVDLNRLIWRGHPFGWGRRPLTPPELHHWSQVLGVEVLYGAADDRGPVLLLERPGSLPPARNGQHLPHLLYPEDLEHRLAGLWDQGRRTLALGLLLPSPWKQGRLHLWTPLPTALQADVCALSLGRLKVNPAGQEVPRDGQGHSP